MQTWKKDRVTWCKMCVTPFTHRKGRIHHWQTSVSSSVMFVQNNHCNLLLSLHLGQWCATLPVCFQLSPVQKAAPFGEESSNYTRESRTRHWTEALPCYITADLFYIQQKSSRDSHKLYFITWKNDAPKSLGLFLGCHLPETWTEQTQGCG